MILWIKFSTDNESKIETVDFGLIELQLTVRLLSFTGKVPF